VDADSRAGSELVLIGAAAAADYYCVLPCNACESGFVPKNALRLN
jgi:hypothetical protein